MISSLVSMDQYKFGPQAVDKLPSLTNCPEPCIEYYIYYLFGRATKGMLGHDAQKWVAVSCPKRLPSFCGLFSPLLHAMQLFVHVPWYKSNKCPLGPIDIGILAPD